jgi:hypothetical protein
VDAPNKDCAECASFTWHYAMRPVRFEGSIHHPACSVAKGARWVTVACDSAGAHKMHRPVDTNLLMALGQALMNATPVIRSARNLVEAPDRCGFDVGIGLMKCAFEKADFDGVRGGFVQEKRRLAFDLAVAFSIGMRRPGGELPVKDANAVAGWCILCGLGGASDANRTAMMRLVNESPTVRVGAIAAIEEIEGREAPAWKRALHWLGFQH